jgi:hypothetical protein
MELLDTRRDLHVLHERLTASDSALSAAQHDAGAAAALTRRSGHCGAERRQAMQKNMM